VGVDCLVGTYHIEGHNFTIGLLDLAEPGDEVPETRLGDNVVGRKYAHAVELRGGVGVRRKVTANDLVFLETTCW